MAVSETAVDENDCPVLLEDNVGRSRKLPVVDSIAQATGEKILPHYHLRLRILSLDGRHAAASLLRCHNVCHVSVFFLLIHTVFSLLIYITHRGFVHCPTVSHCLTVPPPGQWGHRYYRRCRLSSGVRKSINKANKVMIKTTLKYVYRIMAWSRKDICPGCGRKTLTPYVGQRGEE